MVFDSPSTNHVLGYSFIILSWGIPISIFIGMRKMWSRYTNQIYKKIQVETTPPEQQKAHHFVNSLSILYTILFPLVPLISLLSIMTFDCIITNPFLDCCLVISCWLVPLSMLISIWKMWSYYSRKNYKKNAFIKLYTSFFPRICCYDFKNITNSTINLRNRKPLYILGLIEPVMLSKPLHTFLHV